MSTNKKNAAAKILPPKNSELKMPAIKTSVLKRPLVKKIDNHLAGLTGGTVFALLYVLWALLVWASLAHDLLNRLFSLFFILNPFQILPFNLTVMIAMIAGNLVVGYLAGWLFAAIVNRIHWLRS